MSVMANIPIAKWWNANVYVNGYHNMYEGLYQNDPVELSFTTFTGNINNSFNLGNGWNAELSGWYRSQGLEGLLVIKDMGAVNIGLSKQVMKNQCTVRL